MLKKILYYFIYLSGIHNIAGRIYNRYYGNSIRLLYAHRVINSSNELYPLLKRLGNLTLEEYEKRIKYLIKKNRFISIDEYQDYYDKKKKPATNLMVFTVDDGYSCSYENILPLLKKYNIPATIFVATGNISTALVLFQDILLSALGNSELSEFRMSEISDRTYSLKTEKNRIRAYKDINQRLKRIDNDEKIKIIGKLFKILQVSPSKICKGNRMLTWDEVRQMRDSKLISFGAHTVSHPILTKIPVEEARLEIEVSKTTLEKELGEKIKYMAYPNGRADDFNDEIIAIVKENRFKMAFTTMEDQGRAYDRYEIPRYGFVSEPFYMFALRMSGFFDILHKVRDRFLANMDLFSFRMTGFTDALHIIRDKVLRSADKR